MAHCIIGMHALYIIKNGKVGNILITCIGGITDSHIISFFRKECRHHLQSFIMLLLQRFVLAGIHFGRTVLVSSIQGRNSVIGNHSKGKRARIISKSVKLFI